MTTIRRDAIETEIKHDPDWLILTLRELSPDGINQITARYDTDSVSYLAGALIAWLETRT